MIIFKYQGSINFDCCTFYMLHYVPNLCIDVTKGTTLKSRKLTYIFLTNEIVHLPCEICRHSHDYLEIEIRH